MQIILYILIAFGLVGIFSTLLCVICGTDLSELLPVYKPRKKVVGPAFWGGYTGLPEETPDLEKIKLPKISDHEDGPINGSEKYAKGKAVRSLRS
ncbi:MAG: hypothetical protein ACRD3W_03425 [Terriglobales bacterium]